MLRDASLPEGLELIRSTPEFDATGVPKGLLRSHHVAEGVWGVLRVRAGTVVYVTEDDGASRTLVAGETQVIEPEVAHHVEPDADARFVIDFHR